MSKLVNKKEMGLTVPRDDKTKLRIPLPNCTIPKFEDEDNSNVTNDSDVPKKKRKKKDFPEKIYHDDQYHHGALRHILKHLKNELGEDFNKLKKLTIFTDGCTNQYKNKNNCMRLQKLAEDFKIDIIIHGFAATATFKGTHDAYGGHIKDAIVKEQLKTPTSLCNGFDILEALKNSKNLLGVNNQIDPDKQSMMKVTGLRFVLLVREDHAEIDKQYNNVNTSINKDAASIIKSRIEDPNNYDIATICSSTEDERNFNESTKIVASVRCNHTQRILLKDPDHNNKTTLAVRKEQCECDHCRISDFDGCPHESEVGKFIYTTISEEVKALSEAQKRLKADVTDKFNRFKGTDLELRKMIQHTFTRMNRPEEGLEALDARKYCSCNYHGKSGNRNANLMTLLPQ